VVVAQGDAGAVDRSILSERVGRLGRQQLALVFEGIDVVLAAPDRPA